MKLLFIYLLFPVLVYYSTTKDIIVRKGFKHAYVQGIRFNHYKTKNNGWIWISSYYKINKGDSITIVNN